VTGYLFLAFALACAAAYSAWRVRAERDVVRVGDRRRYVGWWACIVLASWLAICSTAIAFSPNL
jgi:hypothetical protein